MKLFAHIKGLIRRCHPRTSRNISCHLRYSYVTNERTNGSTHLRRHSNKRRRCLDDGRLTAVGRLLTKAASNRRSNSNPTRSTYSSCWQYDTTTVLLLLLLLRGGGGSNWLHARLADWLSENVIQAVGRSVRRRSRLATQPGSPQCTLHDVASPQPPFLAPPSPLYPLLSSLDSFLIVALLSMLKVSDRRRRIDRLAHNGFS